MTQSSLHMPGWRLHVAIIMDGNGRWAVARGLPRIAGHRSGTEAVEAIVPAAAELGVSDLTLFAFSGLNWKRPASEVNGLMRIFTRYFRNAARRLPPLGVRLTAIGRRDRIPGGVARAIETAEAATAECGGMRLRVAVDYSSREEIARAAAGGGPSAASIAAALDAPDVDLLIRTGGERRLSDFMLYEAAQAELLFLDRPWPMFGSEILRSALTEFHHRNRTLGGLTLGGLKAEKVRT